MPNLPPSTDFTNSSVTEGGFKTAMTYMREYLASLLGADGVNATALATLGAVFGSLSAKNANYTVIASDRGEIIQCTATLELALTAAATLGSSFSFVVNNTGSGTVTINPSGAELIDGQSTKSLSQGQSAVIYCDGTGFYSVGMSAAGGFSNMQVFTSSGTFTVPAGVTKVKVTVVGGGGGGAGDGFNASPIAGAGGGAGGHAIKIISGLTSGQTVTVTIGAGGAGGTQNASNGNTSSFGAYCSATGGAGATGTAVSGVGGSGAGGDINGIGGGGQPPDGANFSGFGASSILSGPRSRAGVNATPSKGILGAGGTGAVGNNSGIPAGGAGGDGVVIVEY